MYIKSHKKEKNVNHSLLPISIIHHTYMDIQVLRTTNAFCGNVTHPHLHVGA